MKPAVLPTLNVSLAKLDDTDTAELVELINRCYRSGDSWTTENLLAAGPRVVPARLKEIACRPNDEEILVVRDDDELLVGCVWVGRAAESIVGPLDEMCGHLGMLSVRPEWQRAGIGKFLIGLAADRCLLRYGVSKMVIEVLSVRSELIKYYERRGYMFTHRSTPAARFFTGENGEKLLVDCDFNLMEKPLKSVEYSKELRELGPGQVIKICCGDQK